MTSKDKEMPEQQQEQGAPDGELSYLNEMWLAKLVRKKNGGHLNVTPAASTCNSGRELFGDDTKAGIPSDLQNI
jgi:hypothetical protein